MLSKKKKISKYIIIDIEISCDEENSDEENSDLENSNISYESDER